MKLAILIASRNRPDLVEALVQQVAERVQVPHDVFVVECGTDRDRLSRHATLWYPDPDFRGKCFGHGLAVQQARQGGAYDYYWVVMNDLVLAGEGDPAALLIETMEREPRMGILAPTDSNGAHSGSAPRPGGGWRAASTVGYLGFMLRGEALDEAGFLNPDFRYGRGALDELAYRLYVRDWFVAYSDDVTCGHAGESTYGVPGTYTIPRAEYLRRGSRFAYTYFREAYGADWTRRFLAATAGHDVEIDSFVLHEQEWAQAFTEEELKTRFTSVSPARAESVVEPAGDEQREEEHEEPPPIEIDEAVQPANVDEDPVAPLPLATDATLRLLAWPDYDNPAELDVLFGTFATPLLGLAEACLCLRHDPAVDGTVQEVSAALEAAWERTIGAQGALSVLLVDDELDAVDWRRLGAAVDAVIELAAEFEPRTAALAATGARRIASPGDVAAVLGLPGESATAIEPSEPPSASDTRQRALQARLREQVDELGPWSYPVTFGALRVEAPVEPAVATSVETRAARLVDRVTASCDLRGRAVLDLGCECGYWSARWAEAGAASVVGIEPSERCLRQAELYWAHNAFLPPEQRTFLCGDPATPETWQRLERLGPYDVTLWAGELDPTANRYAVLRRAAGNTRELLVLDARIRARATEPELCFDGRAPSGAADEVAGLLGVLRGTGFEPELLPPLSSDPDDDYSRGRRVTILARRVDVLEA